MLSSTIEPTGTGTRIESPESLPSRPGSTRPIAFAAPVVVGTMFTPAARARRGSRCGPSCRFCSCVYACTVVMKPCSMPARSSSTFASGASAFVVHEAFETITCAAGSYASVFTPYARVTSAPSAGALTSTFLAPGVEVGTGGGCRGEAARRLEHEVDLELRPRQVRGVALGEHLDAAAVDHERVPVDLDGAAEPAGGAVEAEQLRERLRVGEVVHGDDLEVGVALEQGAEHVAADAAESVDGDASHAGDSFRSQWYPTSIRDPAHVSGVAGATVCARITPRQRRTGHACRAKLARPRRRSGRRPLRSAQQVLDRLEVRLGTASAASGSRRASPRCPPVGSGPPESSSRMPRGVVVSHGMWLCPKTGSSPVDPSRPHEQVREVSGAGAEMPTPTTMMTVPATRLRW